MSFFWLRAEGVWPNCWCSSEPGGGTRSLLVATPRADSLGRGEGTVTHRRRRELPLPPGHRQLPRQHRLEPLDVGQLLLQPGRRAWGKAKGFGTDAQELEGSHKDR